MSISFKSRGNDQLDALLYNNLLRRGVHERVTNQNYQLYICNWCTEGRTDISRPENWYDAECNGSNTWNYDWKQETGWKDNVMKLNLDYGFGNSQYNGNDDTVIVKAKSHGLGFATTLVSKNNMVQYERNEANLKHGFVFCKHLKNPYGRELNVFIVKDLLRDKIYTMGVYVQFDVSKNVNRKKAPCSFVVCNPEAELGDKYENLMRLCKDTHFDQGRVELIEDQEEGWCIVDMNDSPGKGPITNLVAEPISHIFERILTA